MLFWASLVQHCCLLWNKRLGRAEGSNCSPSPISLCASRLFGCNKVPKQQTYVIGRRKRTTCHINQTDGLHLNKGKACPFIYWVFSGNADLGVLGGCCCCCFLMSHFRYFHSQHQGTIELIGQFVLLTNVFGYSNPIHNGSSLGKDKSNLLFLSNTWVCFFNWMLCCNYQEHPNLSFFNK